MLEDAWFLQKKPEPVSTNQRGLQIEGCDSQRGDHRIFLSELLLIRRDNGCVRVDDREATGYDKSPHPVCVSEATAHLLQRVEEAGNETSRRRRSFRKNIRK